MRTLVTGGAGFLGAALANCLVQGGHTVLALDDLTAGDPRRLSSDVLLTRGDVRDVPKLWTLLQGVDCVYHLAARVRVPESIHYPSDYNALNVGGTVAVMEAMRDTGVRRVVFASSGALYGEQAHQPVGEGQLPNPNSPYGVSKVAAEYYLATLGALYNIETVSLRIFNAYGPGQDLPPSYPPVIPQLLKQAQTGGSLVIFGEGTQTRDFVFLDDVVDALVAAATATDVNRAVISLPA
jgi:UDP-glucose 4-epimerase